MDRTRRHNHATRSREPPLKQLMKSAIPAVLALLILRHQRQPDALFRENPAPLWSFVAATTVYWLIVEAMMRFRRKRQQLILRRGAAALAIQSAVSLGLMFLPHASSLLSLLTWMLLALLLALAWIHRPPVNVMDKVRAMVVRIQGVDVSNQTPTTLPVSRTS